ncbi:hypothetical protein ACSAMQ_20540, partial [Lysobacter sp. 1R34A]
TRARLQDEGLAWTLRCFERDLLEALGSGFDWSVDAEGPSARALYLLGLIEGAKGRDAAAEDYFRKALYLQPQHEEALMHLALLLETRGDAAGGRVLRLRAQRSHRTAG